jgi:hypothetical protein
MKTIEAAKEEMESAVDVQGFLSRYVEKKTKKKRNRRKRKKSKWKERKMKVQEGENTKGTRLTLVLRRDLNVRF